MCLCACVPLIVCLFVSGFVLVCQFGRVGSVCACLFNCYVVCLCITLTENLLAYYRVNVFACLFV